MAALLPPEMAPQFSYSARGGSCLCGEVQFSVLSEPFTRVLCHCLNCQKTSGSAYLASDWFDKDKHVITKGKNNIRVYDDRNNDSGDKMYRSFCKNCGTQVMIKLQLQPDIVIVPTGTFDGADWEIPIKAEYYVFRRFDWAGAVRYSRQYRQVRTSP